ncbi:hypothetical protein [Vibrio anguillarum]|uniref:hypothetical protein n=1 Tax=Vibrio anguillarum TaxID=55601 RepID=UPI0003FFD769|nr:hypothetical protein [Vibrio anguillarum]
MRTFKTWKDELIAQRRDIKTLSFRSGRVIQQVQGEIKERALRTGTVSVCLYGVYRG